MTPYSLYCGKVVEVSLHTEIGSQPLDLVVGKLEPRVVDLVVGKLEPRVVDLVVGKLEPRWCYIISQHIHIQMS